MAEAGKSLLDTKLGAVPVWAKKNLTRPTMTAYFNTALQNYGAKYFAKGKVNPLVHIMAAAGIMGYALSYDHLTHDRMRKHH